MNPVSLHGWQRMAMVTLALLVLMGGLSACGKRGDPYRPSEISSQNT